MLSGVRRRSWRDDARRPGWAPSHAAYPCAPCPNARRTCPAAPATPRPGSNEKMLGKAPGLGADMVFLDLEDSVSPLEKEAARGKVVNAIKNQDWGDTVRVRPGQRVGHRVDLPRRDRRSWRTRASGSTRSCCRRCRTRPRCVALDLLLTQIEKVDRPAEPRRHRGADRDRAGPHQRRGDLRGERPARDDHLRPGRLRRVDRDAGAHRWRADPRVPGRPLPLRVQQDPHGRSRQRPAGDRRSVPQDPRARRAPRLRDALRASSASTASGRCTPTR